MDPNGFMQNHAIQAAYQQEFAQAAMARGVSTGAESVGNATALAVYNLPFSANENDLLAIFPRANRANVVMGQSEPKRSRGMCILQFNSPHECQAVYDEITRGKEVEGRALRVEISTNRRYNNDNELSGNGGDGHSGEAWTGGGGGAGSGQSFRGHQPLGGPEYVSSGCSLSVYNLPWTAGEKEVLQEFPNAVKANILTNDQGQSKGIAVLSFPNRDECSAALVACACKIMNGRPLRAEIRDHPDSEPSGERDYGHSRRLRDDDHRGSGGGGRDRDHDRRDRDRDHERGWGGGRGGRGGRDRDNYRDRDRDNYRDRGDRNRFRGGRDDRRGNRGGRDNRRPSRDQQQGPRITSAVIRRLPGESSDSDFDDDHTY